MGAMPSPSAETPCEGPGTDPYYFGGLWIRGLWDQGPDPGTQQLLEPTVCLAPRPTLVGAICVLGGAV